MNRTIICLAAKRSGTTAVQRVFARHPQVSICHPEQDVEAWEANFWNLAGRAIEAKEEERPIEDRLHVHRQFESRVAIMMPGLTVPAQLTPDDAFGVWDAILERYGPVVFDKSPKYIVWPQGLRLLRTYMDRGNDVRLFALVRDPRDTIVSQFELWKEDYAPGTPQFREDYWVKGYRTLEAFRDEIGAERCPLIRHEDLSRDPKTHMGKILAHCGLDDAPESYRHLAPVAKSRYARSEESAIKDWRFGDAIRTVAAQYGYDLNAPIGVGDPPSSPPRKNGGDKGPGRAGLLLRHAFDMAFRNGFRRLPVRWREKMITRGLDLVTHGLGDNESLRVLFRIENRLYQKESMAALRYGGGIHPKKVLTRYHDFFITRIGDAQNVLDVGCGNGALSWDIARWTSARVLGVDVNADSIAMARERFAHPRVTYHNGDVLEDLPGGTFDIVILSNVLEHIPSRIDFLRRLVEITKPSRVLIRLPLFERDWRVPLKRELTVEWRLDSTHFTEYTLESFAEEMEMAGLKTIYQEVRWGEIWADLAPAGAAASRDGAKG